VPDQVTAPKNAEAARSAIKERAVSFGPGGGLIGIETSAAGDRSGNRPAVILLNAGVIHRIGPHRFHVALARRLAAAGHTVLRFDLSGVGDSRARAGVSFEASAAQDVADAMDHLEKTAGVHRFVVAGICSGADNSLRAATADARVAGIALFDPYSYRTAGFYLRAILARARKVDSWAGLVRRKVAPLWQRWAGNAAPPPPPPPAPVRQYSRRFPPREVFAEALRSLLDRGTGVLIIYSGGISEIYNYAGQFDDAFRPYGLVGRVECHFLPDVTHTYTSLGSQRRMGDILTEWLAKVSGPGAADARSAAPGAAPDQPRSSARPG
jgi:pimeloyl-ACP methyl ester carboxylesterase